MTWNRKKSRSQRTVICTIFFNHFELILKKPGISEKSVNLQLYRDSALTDVSPSLQIVWPNKGTIGIKLFRANTPAPISELFHKFLAEHNIETRQHALYRPNLASCDLLLLPSLKICLVGCRSDPHQLQNLLKNIVSSLSQKTALNVHPKSGWNNLNSVYRLYKSHSCRK